MAEQDFDPVLLSLGSAVFAAQLFEMNLGTTLVALTLSGSDKGVLPDEAAARTWLEQAERLPAALFKRQIGDLRLFPDKIVEEIAEVNRIRIEVVHHFTNQWVDRIDTEPGRRAAIQYLDECTDMMLSAARKLQAGLERLSETSLLDQ